MKIIGVIPARYKSSRFPGKPLADICGKPMIQHVYERVGSVSELEGLYVATDDERIFDAVKSFGGNVVMTSPVHSCGTDRLAECAEKLLLCNEDIVLNVQGDEPLVEPQMVRDLIHIFDNTAVYMGTLKKKLDSDEDIQNQNVVKVVTDRNGDALYFSRSRIPFVRNAGFSDVYKHVGMYGYTVRFLKEYSHMQKMPLELTESLEQLRVLEMGLKIRVAETNCETIGVDTPKDLERVRQYMKWLNRRGTS